MKISYSVTIGSLTALGLALSATAAQAAAGGLDPAFGSGGTVITSYNGPAPSDALPQPDGKIVVVAGFDNDPSATEAFGVLRYQANGALDTSFGVAGRATAAFTNFINSPNDAALQSDGKIVVAGNAQSADGTLSEFAVARFNANGTLDSTFGTGGKVTTNFVGVQAGGVSNPATSVLIQSDGKILVAGSASQCARRCPLLTALARYNTNGSLDTSFGSGGTVGVTSIGAIHTLGEDAAGDIFGLNGALIAEFSPSGVLQSQVTPSPIATASTEGFAVSPAVFQPDGRYLVSGGSADHGNGYLRDTDAQVVRYQQTGVVDPSFASPAFDFSGSGAPNETDLAQGIALQPNGQVVLAGYHSSNGSTSFTTARLNAGGSLDTTFGPGGTVTAGLPAGGQASAALIQPDGKVVIVGQGFIAGGGVDLVLIRYLGQ